MTMRFAESFDWCQNVAGAGLFQRQYVVTGLASRTTGRVNGFAVRLSAGVEFAHSLQRVLGGSYATGYFGVSVRMPSSFPSGNFRFLTLRNGNVNQLSLQARPDGSLSVLRDTTVLATTAPFVLAVNAWHRIELFFVIGDTTGAYELRVDTVNVLSATNVDTRNGTPIDVDNFVLSNISGTGSTNVDYDSVTFNDDQGSVNNSFLGDLHIEQLRPSSDVLTGWTPSTGTSNFALVDDSALDTADFVSAPTAPAEDRYGLTDLSATPSSVFAVQALYHASKNNAGEATMRSRVVSGSDIADGSTVSLNSTPFFYADIVETDPQGGGAWTGSRVNSAQLGIQRVT